MPPITATTTVQYWTDGGAFIRRRATTVLCPASCARLRLRLHVGQHEGTCPVLSFPLSYLAVAADRRQQRLRALASYGTIADYSDVCLCSLVYFRAL